MKKDCGSAQVAPRRTVRLPMVGAPSSVREGAVRPSRTSRWRAAALIALNLLMIAHFVQWRLTGRTVSPIEPSETMFTLQNGYVNAGFIFFTLAILSTLVLGRFVCGWGCHVLALQDFCAWLMKKVGVTPRPFRSRLLVYVPLLAALYMFVWPTALRYFTKPKEAPLIPELTNHLVTTEFWATFPPLAVAVPFLFVCGFMTVYFLGSKGFCTYACPYGGFFALADRVAPVRIRVTDACNQCGHCTAVCTSNVVVHAEVAAYKMVVDPGCMKCMDCISVCPNDALYLGFGRPAVAAPQTLPRRYSLTWPEELLGAAAFVVSLWSVWDVYQLVPMLMALGWAGVTTFVVLWTVKLARAKDLAFHRFLLKASGRVERAGWVFAAFALPWILLTAHSGWVRYHEAAGTRAYERIRLPDELALARAKPEAWLTPADLQVVNAGRRHLQTAAEGGLFANTHAQPKRAWLEYLAGNTEEAVRLLGAAAEQQRGQGRALGLYYRGAILNRLGRPDEALASLDAALAERPDLIAAREERGESLWRLGRRPDAIAAWTDAVRTNPSLVVGNHLLAGAAEAVGQREAAAAHEKQADQVTPDDPYFHWMIGQRLQHLGMGRLADKHFRRAVQLDPRFRARRDY
jgi:tetratricopeptide (TPR) repeat protein/NAD-dependent dihydropyrimidine dehydrogenase PreA subunit